MGLRFDRVGAHFTRVRITNQVQATDYSEDAPDYMCHTQYGYGKKSEPFSLDLDLMDPESLKEAIQRANSDRAEADSDGSQLGPGFPSILVGPNGAGSPSP